jgi:hypothetical protein
LPRGGFHEDAGIAARDPQARPGAFDRLLVLRWQTAHLPAYSVWAAIVVVGFPGVRVRLRKPRVPLWIARVSLAGNGKVPTGHRRRA